MDSVVSFTASMRNIYAIVKNGDLYAIGRNTTGQLGVGNTGTYTIPVKINLAGPVKKVVASGEEGLSGCACALLQNGTVWCWGNNASGQLGIGNLTSVFSPVQVGASLSMNDVTDIHITGGDAASVCVVRNHTNLWCWGANSYGTVGNGNTTNQTSPVPITSVTDTNQILSMTGAGNTRCILKANGKVYCWGEGTNGQLGNNTTPTVNANPVQVTGITTAKQLVGAGNRFGSFFVILADSTVRAWGYNATGTLGDATFTNRSAPVTTIGLSGVKQVSIGGAGTYGSSADFACACALSSNGRVKCWGQNQDGAVGNGLSAPQNIPADVVGLTNVRTIRVGGNYYPTPMAILNDGRMKIWGRNTSGQLGNGNTTNSYIPSLVKDLNE